MASPTDARRARLDARLQPSELPLAAEYDQTKEAKSIDRLAADLDLINTLALRGFSGPDYDYFAGELAKYGMAVIGGWLRRGLIFRRAEERGLGGLPRPPAAALDDPETIAELTNETVAKALFHFRCDVLLRGRWDSTRGASIRTYFIGQCLLRFANVYREWWRKEARHGPVVDHYDAVKMADGRIDGPEQTAIIRSDIRNGLEQATNEKVRAALIMVAADLPHEEIADRLGVTEKSVERMVAYHRERMRKKGFA
jgi:hypothetical protein